MTNLLYSCDPLSFCGERLELIDHMAQVSQKSPTVIGAVGTGGEIRNE